MRKLPHPCVIFDDDLLNEIRQKIGHADWAKAAYEKAYKASEEWSYPSIDFNNDYLFDTSHAHHARDCAIIYQISGETRFFRLYFQLLSTSHELEISHSRLVQVYQS